MDAQSGLIPDFISTLLWAGLLAILGVSAATFSWIDYSTSNVFQLFLPQTSPSVITLNEEAEKILSPGKIVEGPSLSPNGEKLVFITKIYEDDLLDFEIHSVWLAKPASEGGWLTVPIAEGRRTFLGEMASYFNPSFDAQGENVIAGSARFWNILGIPILPTLRISLEIYSPSKGQTHRLLTPSELGMPKEVIFHPKISPDGKWLAFYTRKRIESRGIYLLHLKTRKLYHISREDDKHPTWAPEGRRLLFHHQRGGQALDPVPKGFPEQAYLGYFDLTFNGEDGVSWRRVLMDPITDTYTYRKHPANPPKTDLVFFHAKLSPKGKHMLMVRRLGINTPVYIVAPTLEGQSMKEAKHPATAVYSQELVFLGKTVDEKFYSFYRLTPAALKKIQEQVSKYVQ